MNAESGALNDPPAGRPARMRPWLVALAAVVLLFALYAAAGYLWAPRLIEDQAKAYARTQLKQDLAIGDVRVDPFRFTVDIDSIAIPAASPMVRLKALHLNFAARSIFSDSYRFDEIRLTEPDVQAVIRPDGRLNLLDLVPPPNPDPFPPVLIADLKVEGGRALFADHSKPNHPDARLAPIGFRLQNLHTTRDEGGGFTLQGKSDADEEFVWKGHLSMAPIASRGGLAIRRLKAGSIQEFGGHMLPVSLADGTVDLDLGYVAAYGDAGGKLSALLTMLRLSGLKAGGGADLLRADIEAGQIAVNGVRLDVTAPPGGDIRSAASVSGVSARNLRLVGTGPAAGEGGSLAAVDVSDIRLVPATSGFAIGAVRLSGLDIATSRDARGGIGLMRLIPPTRAAGQGAAAMGYPTVGEFSLTDAKFRFVDRAVKPAATWVVTPLSVTARSADGRIGGPMRVSASGRLNGATAFSADGSVDPAAPGADVAVKLAGFPVKAAVPYTVDFPRLEIASGTASANGRIRHSPKGTGYTGSAAIDNLKLVETYQGTDLVSWKRLELTGIDATPKKAVIDRVRLSQPYGNLTIFPDGTLNFQRLVTFNPQPVVVPAADVTPPERKLTRAERRAEAQRLEAEKQATAAKARAALAAPVVEPAIPVLVKRVDVSGGTMDFADFSLRPNFGAKVQGIGGHISNVSNSPRAVAKLKLDGYVVDKFSPVSIEGELTPLQYDRRTHVDMAFRNIELPVFNPYSGRWAGYSIAKGKLTTELGYRIDNRALEATHHIVIDQLEWGEATDSKEKVSMPIKFATSLLKDKNGVIELDVPVSGTLDDPSFKLGPIIWKVIGNLFEKVLTAPFRALGDLFGGKEDVQFVDFAPGSASVPTDAASNLAGIAKGLADKPELRLDIPSGPGLPLDAQGLADGKIAAAAMAKEVKKGEPADLSALALSTRHDRLHDLYKARFRAGPKVPEGPAGETKEDRRTREIDWMMAELRKSFAPTPAELAALGKARAEAVRLALLEGGTAVDPARLFLSGRESATERDGKARMELKLEGS